MSLPCPTLLLALGLASTSSRSLGLDDAIEIAMRRSAEVVRAETDVVLVDVERARALAPVLPRVDLWSGVQEVFLDSVITETRSAVALPQDSLRPEQRVNANLAWGRFIDSQTSDISHPQLTLGLRASQLLFDGGRWWTVLERVGDIERQRRATLAAVRNNVKARVIAGFYSVLKAAAQARTVEQQVELDREQLERARKRLADGGGKPDEVAAAERNLAQDRVALLRARNAVASQRWALALALGLDPVAPIELVPPEDLDAGGPPRVELPTTPALIERARRERPELDNLRALREQVVKNVAIRRADYWPRVSLDATYSRLSRRPDRTFGDPTRNFTGVVGLNLSWNLFAGLGHATEVEAAELELDKLDATILATEQSVAAEILNRAASIEVLVASWALEARGAAAAEDAVRLARSRYEEGRATALELRDAELGLTRARQSLTNVHLDLEIALADLERAIGGPLHRPDGVGSEAD
jgi:outer membrane protein TolC